MNIPALHADETPHSATGYRGCSQSYRLASVVRSGHAPNIVTPPNSDGLPELQAQRDALMIEAARQRNLRRNRQASLIEAELRRVTHEILNTRRRTDA